MLDDIVTKLILGDDAATNDQPDKDELEQQSSDAEIAAVAVITAAEGPDLMAQKKLTMGMDNSTKAPIKELTFITEVSGRSFSGLFGLWFLLRWSCGLWFFHWRGSMLIVSGHDGRRDIREEIVIPGKGAVLQVFHHA